MPRKGHSPEQILTSSGKSRLPSPVARASVRQSVGERIQRELQRGTQGLTAKPGDLLFVEGGAGTYRTVEKGVQHDPPTQLTWIPTN